MSILELKSRPKGFSLYFMGKKIFSYQDKMRSKRYIRLYKKRFNPDFSIENKIELISRQFQYKVGYPLNLERPQTFNEKIQWLKLFHSDPLMNICCDKYKVKEYLQQIIAPEHLIATLQSWDDPNDIDFSTLPDNFVLKVNWGSGQNIIIRDKANIDLTGVKDQLQKWMNPKANHYYHSFEPSYKDIKPKVICEPYIGELSENLTCYKFFTFSGKPSLIQVVFNDKTAEETINYYDLNWNLLPIRQNYPNNPAAISKPATLETMIELAEKLAQPFQHFVRVDFYEVSGKIIFSEFTFFSDNGMAPFFPQEWDEKLGKMLHLPA